MSNPTPLPHTPLGPRDRPTALAGLGLRGALSAGFVSAVADRFGLWGDRRTPGVAWGDYATFLDYTHQLLPFLPRSVSDALGGLATALELLLTVLLLLGVLRAALASALLLTVFGIAMLISLGPKAPLDYNVFTAAAAAFSLYSLRRSGLAPFAKKSRLCSVAGLRMRS